MTSTAPKRPDWVSQLRRFLGGFYILAAVLKIPDPAKFAEVIGNYVIPHEMIYIVERTIPAIEVVVGVFLLIGIWQKAISLLLRLFVSGFYIIAGAVKIPNPGKFAEAVGNYRILPHEMVDIVAITLPWIEVVAGVFLIVGIWQKSSAWLINAMTVTFIAAISSAVIRGLSIECGCFGTVGGRRVGLEAIAEDLLLLGSGLWIVCRAPKSAPPTVPMNEGLPSPGPNA